MSLLGLSSGAAGEFRQRIGYNAKSGRMERVDRSQDAAGTWVNNPVDITQRAVFVMDLARLRVGWLEFGPTGPVKALVNVGEPWPAKPSDEAKRGFECTVVLHDSAADGTETVREFSANSITLGQVMEDLYARYLAAPESKAGKLPVVRLAGTKPVKAKHGTNYEPVFEIAAWVDRPAVLNGEAAPAQQQAAPVASPPAAPVSPPPAPAAAPAINFGDFG